MPARSIGVSRISSSRSDDAADDCFAITSSRALGADGRYHTMFVHLSWREHAGLRKMKDAP